MDLKPNVGTPESAILFVRVANMIFLGEIRIKNALNAPVIAIVMKLTGSESIYHKVLIDNISNKIL